MAMPFLPAPMKYSTSSSSECRVTSGTAGSLLFGACRRTRLPVRAGAAVLGVSSTLVGLRSHGGRHDDVAGQGRDVAMVCEQRAVLAGGDEIDADRVLPRITARPILDLQLVAVVLFVALHRHRARRHRQRLGDAFELVFVGEVVAVGARGEQRFHDFTRMASTLDGFQELLVRDHPLQQLLELGAGRSRPVGRRGDAHGRRAPF